MRATRLVIVALLLVTGTLLFASGQPPKEEPKPAAAPVKLTFWGWGPHVDALTRRSGRRTTSCTRT